MSFYDVNKQIKLLNKNEEATIEKFILMKSRTYKD